MFCAWTTQNIATVAILTLKMLTVSAFLAVARVDVPKLHNCRKSSAFFDAARIDVPKRHNCRKSELRAPPGAENLPIYKANVVQERRVLAARRFPKVNVRTSTLSDHANARGKGRPKFAGLPFARARACNAFSTPPPLQ